MYTVVSIYSQVPLIIISGFASKDVMEEVFFCLFVLELTLDCQVVKCQVGQACSQLQIIEYPHIYNFVYFTYTYKFTLSIQQLDIHSLYTCCISGSKYTSSLNICRLYS